MENFLEQIRKNWIIFTFVVGLIMWFANVNAKVDELDKRVYLQENMNKEYLTTLQRIQLDLAIVRTKLEKLER